MGIRLLTGQISPIVADFGHASVKLLQVSQGAAPELVAAAELPLPEDLRDDVERRDAYIAERIPSILRNRGFKGRRVVVSPHASTTFIEHLQIPSTEGVDSSEQVRLQIQSRLSRAGELVIRSWQVGEVHRDEGLRHEHICVAVERREVMKLVEMFRRLRLSVVGVHDGVGAMVRSFGHLHRRESDQQRRTVYIDLGHGHTRLAITEGTRIVFAKSIPTGGRDLAVVDRIEAASPTPVRSRSIAGVSIGALTSESLGVSVAEDRRSDGTPQELSRSIPDVPAVPRIPLPEHARRTGDLRRRRGSKDRPLPGARPDPPTSRPARRSARPHGRSRPLRASRGAASGMGRGLRPVCEPHRPLILLEAHANSRSSKASLRVSLVDDRP